MFETIEANHLALPINHRNNLKEAEKPVPSIIASSTGLGMSSRLQSINI